MLHERRAKIIQMVSEDRIVKVCNLVSLFNVSIETIRRDLEYLEKKGYVNRVYGGAVVKSMYGVEPEYSLREVKHYTEKVAIGKVAADLIDNGDTVIIDVGTTTLEFAKHIKGKKKITVITNAIQIAMELVDDSNIRVIMIGGDLRSGEYSTSGFLAENCINVFNIDKAILGVGGLTPGRGITDYHIEEGNLRRAFVERSEKIIALADYSKFGVTAMNNVCPTSRINTVVTDSKAPQKMLSEIKALGVNVIVVAEE